MTPDLPMNRLFPFWLPLTLLCLLLTHCAEPSPPLRGGGGDPERGFAPPPVRIIGCQGDEECPEGFRCQAVSPESRACVKGEDRTDPRSAPPRPPAPLDRLSGASRFRR